MFRIPPLDVAFDNEPLSPTVGATEVVKTRVLVKGLWVEEAGIFGVVSLLWVVMWGWWVVGVRVFGISLVLLVIGVPIALLGDVEAVTCSFGVVVGAVQMGADVSVAVKCQVHISYQEYISNYHDCYLVVFS